MHKYIEHFLSLLLSSLTARIIHSLFSMSTLKQCYTTMCSTSSPMLERTLKKLFRKKFFLLRWKLHHELKKRTFFARTNILMNFVSSPCWRLHG